MINRFPTVREKILCKVLFAEEERTALLSLKTRHKRYVPKWLKLGKNGYFGTKGKNTQVFKSSDPLKSSSDFYKRISKGGQKLVLSNGKGVQTVFPDGSRVVYREITKTPNSPAVSITVTNPKKIKSQKIHFIK